MTRAEAVLPLFHTSSQARAQLQYEGCKELIKEGVELLGGRLDAGINNAGVNHTDVGTDASNVPSIELELIQCLAFI